MRSIGYKQLLVHDNVIPCIKNQILDLSTLYRYKDGSKNKPDRYYFDVTLGGGGLNNAYKHAYYFDSIQNAKKSHKQLSLKFYDQLTSPFLQKIKSKRYLTTRDKERILEILDKIDDYKKMSDIILR